MTKVASDSILQTTLKGIKIEEAVLQSNAVGISNPNSVKKAVNTVATAFGPRKKVEEVVDERLVQASRQTLLNAVGIEVKTDACSAISAQFGEEGSQLTFSHFAERMATQFHELAAIDSAGMVGAKMRAISNIKLFLSQTASFCDVIQTQKRDADIKIQNTLLTINDSLEKIRKCNLNIVTALEGDFSGVEGVRAALNEIAQHIDVYVRQESDGTYTVFSDRGGAQILVNGGEAASFNYISPPSVDYSTVFSPITVTYQGQTSIDLTTIFSNKNGSIGSALYVRDVLTPSLQKQMDLASSALYKKFNTIHNLGTSTTLRPIITGEGIPTAKTITGAELLDPAQISGTVRFALINSDLKFGAVPTGQVNYKDINLSGFNAFLGSNPPTINKFVEFLNNEFGANLAITASIINNQLRLQSVNGSLGISIGEQGVPPSQVTLSSGQQASLSEFFGLNNLLSNLLLAGDNGFAQQLGIRTDLEMGNEICLGSLTSDTPPTDPALFGTHIAEKLYKSWFDDMQMFIATPTLATQNTSMDDYFKLIIKTHENMTKTLNIEKKFADQAHIETSKIVQKYSKADAIEIEAALTKLATFQKLVLQMLRASIRMEQDLIDILKG